MPTGKQRYRLSAILGPMSGQGVSRHKHKETGLPRPGRQHQALLQSPFHRGHHAVSHILEALQQPARFGRQHVDCAQEERVGRQRARRLHGEDEVVFPLPQLQAARPPGVCCQAPDLRSTVCCLAVLFELWHWKQQRRGTQRAQR